MLLHFEGRCKRVSGDQTLGAVVQGVAQALADTLLKEVLSQGEIMNWDPKNRMRGPVEMAISLGGTHTQEMSIKKDTSMLLSETNLFCSSSQDIVRRGYFIAWILVTFAWEVKK